MGSEMCIRDSTKISLWRKFKGFCTFFFFVISSARAVKEHNTRRLSLQCLFNDEGTITVAPARNVNNLKTKIPEKLT